MHPPNLRISTPGRICLFGEHQDYLGLPVIAAAISRRVTIEGALREDNRIELKLPDVDSEVSFSLDGKLPYSEERDYFRSCVNVLRKHGHRFSRGYDCTVRGNIPINAGTSSSSALVVSWLHFLSVISDDRVLLSPEGIGTLAYEAEVLEFSEPGGMMDQYSTAIGGLIFLESQPQIKINYLGGSLGSFVLGNSHQNKDTKSILARVRGEVLDAAAALRKIHPEFSFHKTNLAQLESFAKRITSRQYELLEATIVNRNLTFEARDLLMENTVDHARIGALLNIHQDRLRDVLGISTPKIDSMIQKALEAGALGAKINGSGGGGCMFAYAPENAEEVAEAVGQIGEAMVITIDEGTRRERANE
ncbi:MAG: galactokinase family protein [Bacteroidota bacterium]